MERQRNIMQTANLPDYAYPARYMPQRPCVTTLDRSSFQTYAAEWGAVWGKRRFPAATGCRARLSWRFRVGGDALTNGRASGAATSR